MKVWRDLNCQLIKGTRLNILHEVLHKVVLQSVEVVFQIFIKSSVNIFLLEKRKMCGLRTSDSYQRSFCSSFVIFRFSLMSIIHGTTSVYPSRGFDPGAVLTAIQQEK